jgi:hypothetical protein
MPAMSLIGPHGTPVALIVSSQYALGFVRVIASIRHG